jgi:hypothetical protein
MKKLKQKIDGPFVPILHETIDTPAWRQLSNDAKWIYVLLKRRVARHRNMAWMSYRDAHRETGMHNRTIQRCFLELVHYGFLVKVSHGHLGSEGNGIASKWRLTELGCTRATSINGIWEPPTKNYKDWDGALFERQKTKPRGQRWQRGVATVGNGPAATVGNRDSRKRCQRRQHRNAS